MTASNIQNTGTLVSQHLEELLYISEPFCNIEKEEFLAILDRMVQFEASDSFEAPELLNSYVQSLNRLSPNSALIEQSIFSRRMTNVQEIVAWLLANQISKPCSPKRIYERYVDIFQEYFVLYDAFYYASICADNLEALEVILIEAESRGDEQAVEKVLMYLFFSERALEALKELHECRTLDSAIKRVCTIWEAAGMQNVCLMIFGKKA